ncbi:MAG: Stk1 family PASTA domain-containing Ser/Thr kinase [Lachnospiraceae bacterium]|nr:Stk1 family PASTA domain-containing Ser/Thr kinase [Lachnospiraceae bacterium]
MLTKGSYLADRYEILDKIGTGGMSDVYKAMDHILGREVAVKVLKQEFAEDVTFVTKFRSEAQSAAGLEHPNIVNIYDVGSENGMYYIVMEYVEGITLKTYIEKKGQLNFKEAISIAIQVGRGIEAAHNKGIIHRDIKPQNIIISTEGKVKVTDFGIARATSSNTIHADVMGSVHYASPEQARNGYVDGKSDIYSLGIVMYEMVTGRVPFDGDTTVAVALQHLQEEMVAPSAYAPELPISLEKIILKCTMKSPDRRYAAIEDLLLDLKKALVSPNEDFVTMGSAEEVEKTRVISPEEQEQIKEGLAGDADEDDELMDDEDDEDEGPVNPKLDKAITIMGIAAAVIIIAIVIYIVGSFFGLFKFGTKKNDTKDKDSQTQAEQVEMIRVLGMTEDEAASALKKAGVSYEIVYESSDDAEEGDVIKQSVKEGEKIPSTEKVKITVCKEGDLEIPSVVGMDGDSAIQTLKDKGFKANRTFEYSADVAEGQVINQTPTGVGKKGDTITIVVSAGIQSVQVPSLANKTQQEAANELAAVGLQVGNVTTEYSDNYAAGRVIRQSVTQGKTVDAGTAVDIVISDGKKPEYYSYSGSVSNTYKVPVSVVLKDANGSAIASWDLPVDQSLNISAKDIATSSGTIEITGDGVNETKTVTFTKQ